MDKVKDWLGSLALSQYGDNFERDGWDDMDTVRSMSEEDVKSVVDKPGHVRKIVISIHRLNNDKHEHGDQGSSSNLKETAKSDKDSLVIDNTVSELHYHATSTDENKKNEMPGATSERHDSIIKPETTERQVSVIEPETSEHHGSFIEPDTTLERHDSVIELDQTLERHDGVIERITTLERHDSAIEPERSLQRHDSAIKLETTLESHDSALKHIVKTHTHSENVGHRGSRRQLASREQDLLSLVNMQDWSSLACDNALANNSSPEGEMSLCVPEDQNVAISHGTVVARTVPTLCSSATIIKDSHNITVAKEVQIISTETISTTTNYESQIDSCLKKYNERKKLFVKTRAYKEAMDILEDRDWDVVIGNPGDGKSAIAHQLLLDHTKKGYLPIIVTSPNDWKQMVVGKGTHAQKQIVLIDDMFGVSNVNETTVNEWLCLLELMGTVVSERKGQLKVVCTNRKSIFNHVTNKIKKFKEFGKLAIVDLCVSPFSLSFEERVEILTTYFKHYGIHVQYENFFTNAIEDIASIDFNYGFPHCVEIFCTNSVVRVQGMRFFKCPMKIVQSEIEEYQMHDKRKFCALLLVLLSKDNAICMENLDEMSDIFGTCLKLSGLSTNKTKYALNEAFIGLQNVYLSHEEGVFSFKHDSFREIMAMHFVKAFPKHAIQMLELDFLVNWTEFFESNASQLTVAIPLTNTKELAERWTHEILKGNCFIVMTHQSWDDISFQDCWLQLVTTGKSPKGSLLSKCFKQKTLDIGVLGLRRQRSLLECIAMFKYERLLRKLLSIPTLCSYIDIQNLSTQATDALVYSTYNNLSSSLLQTLIDAGAAIDHKYVADTRLDSFAWFFNDTDMFEPKGSSLMHAVKRNNLSNVNVLLQNGANPYDTNDGGVHIFALAVSVNASSILESLFQSVTQRGSHILKRKTKSMDLTYIRYFIEIDYEYFFCKDVLEERISDRDTLEVVMKHYTKAGTCATWQSTQENSDVTADTSINIVKMSTPQDFTKMKPGQDINVNDLTLHEIVTRNRHLLKSGSCQVSPDLITEKDCNTYDEEGKIPLFYALEFSNEIEESFIVRIFEKSDMTIKDKRQRNCLHFLAQSHPHPQQNVQIERILKCGVDINAPDKDGNMPVSLTSSFEVLEIFHRNGAKFGIKNDQGADILMQILLQNTSDIIEKVLFILENDVDVNMTDAQNKTVLHYLVNTKYAFEVKKTVFDLLHQHGFNSNTDILKSAISWHTQSPNCTVEMVDLLMNSGENLFSSTEDGVHFLELLSQSPLSTNMKVSCLQSLRACQNSDFGKTMLKSFLLWRDINQTSCKRIVSLMNPSASTLEEFIFMTLTSELTCHEKHALVKALMSTKSVDMIELEKYMKHIDVRLKLLANPSCLNLLRRNGLRVESIRIHSTNFDKLVTENSNLLKAFRSYVRQGINLDGVITLRQISSLANIFASFGYFRSLFSLMKAHVDINITIVDNLGNTILHNIMSNHGQMHERTLTLICSSLTDINLKNNNNETALFIACRVKKPELMKIRCLLKHGGDINYPHPSGTTPLHLLMQRIAHLSEADIVHMGDLCSELISIGAVMDRLDNHGLTPLMYLISKARSGNLTTHLLSLLLKQDQSIQQLDVDGQCLLHYLARSNLYDDDKSCLSKTLLDKGLLASSVDFYGRLPIDIVLKSTKPHLELCKQLSHMSPTTKVAQCVLNNVKHVKDTFMEELLCQILIEMNISINWQDVTGVTCLLLACRFANSSLVGKLLSSGSDPNIPDVLGQSPLFAVLFSEHAIDISLLFRQCFGINMLDELEFFARGTFPWLVPPPHVIRKFDKSMLKIQGKIKYSLHREVIESINKFLEIVQLLLYHGADPNQLDTYGKSPLHYCAEAPLLDSLICPFMEILISHGADVNSEDFEGRTPMMLCAGYERTKSRRMNILIKAGADLFCKDYTGRTIRDYALQAAYKRVQFKTGDSGNDLMSLKDP